MIPCSSIAYTATRPISNRSAISGTEMRLLSRPVGVSLGCSESGVEQIRHLGLIQGDNTSAAMPTVTRKSTSPCVRLFD